MLYVYAILTALCISGSTANDGPLVHTSLGKINGFHRTSFDGRVFSAFEGIPYAKPPVGDLRFEAPRPVSPWSNVLNANKQYVCKQQENPFHLFEENQSEDCLYLNVYVPKAEPSENDNFDVIVNIHGGAFMMGASSFAGPHYLMDRDIIYVNLNYRLGILGFLSTEDDIVPGNNGLKDQQLALKWVQTHIKQFGGNPRSITLMGASAGSASVHFHYFSPKSKGLFHRAISQSGTALMPWTIQKGALQKARRLAVAVNCHDSNTQTLINCLKKVPVDDLIKKTMDFYDVMQFPIAPFGPIVEAESESSFLTKHPYKQLEDGDVNDVPWLTWISKDEGMMGITSLIHNMDKLENQWNEWSEHIFDYKYICTNDRKEEIAQKIKSFYFGNEKVSKKNINKFIKAFGDRLINVGFETAVQMQAKVVDSPIYAAIYGYSKSTTMMDLFGIELEGVPHGAEGPLLHDLPFIKQISAASQLSESEILMKNVLIDFVIFFAKNGKPQSNGVEWEPINADHPNYLLINDIDDLKMANIPELTAKKFWENLNFLENGRAERIRDEL